MTNGSALEQAREALLHELALLLQDEAQLAEFAHGMDALESAARAPLEARITELEAERDRLAIDVTTMERELHRQRLSYAEVQERSERTRQDLMDERARRMAAEAKSEQMREALRLADAALTNGQHLWALSIVREALGLLAPPSQEQEGGEQ